MKSFMLTPLLAGLGYALPQDAGCETTTEEVIVPTSTATYYSTYVTTIEATTAEDLGTYTEIVGVSSTKIVATVTAPADDCTATTSASPTLYTTAPAPTAYKRALGLNPRACTVTSTFTTTYGQTYTFLQASGASTFTDYTAFTQETVTSTSYGGTAYAVATASASDSCGAQTSGATLDSRCAPDALISAAGGRNESAYGLVYADSVPIGGAVYDTTSTDGSQCCQLCVDADQCAASAWDSRTGVCKLAFPVDPESGDLNCGEGFLAYYGAGPEHPMAPGSGLYVANVCGDVGFGSAMPDDGT